MRSFYSSSTFFRAQCQRGCRPSRCGRRQRARRQGSRYSPAVHGKGKVEVVLLHGAVDLKQSCCPGSRPSAAVGGPHTQRSKRDRAARGALIAALASLRLIVTLALLLFGSSLLSGAATPATPASRPMSVPTLGSTRLRVGASREDFEECGDHFLLRDGADAFHGRYHPAPTTPPHRVQWR